MTREQLEHLLRASARIVKQGEFIVVGSQSILGQFPQAPLQLLVSMEADIYPRLAPELADLIDGAIGEGSQFHEHFGYYAQGVGPDTARLPRGWEGRLVRIESPATEGAVGWCLEVHDLAISKYVAGRAKDLEFTRELARLAMTRQTTLLQRAEETAMPGALGPIVKQRITAQFRVL
jgi:hypothetical protein